jgi:hypothetical protein
MRLTQLSITNFPPFQDGEIQNSSAHNLIG